MPEETLLHALKEFNHRHNLIERGDKVIVSVSGGIDSMSLLAMMERLRSVWNLRLAVAHFNHRLRGNESEQDEAFVRCKAKEYDIECHVERADTRAISEARKQSIQETARDLRYAFFASLSESLGIRKVATAHNADDNIETLLFNLFRGAGIHGLSGIPTTRSHGTVQIIRPLLFASREKIVEYANANAIVFREDSSNLKDDYSRNYIRKQILPALREHINPGLNATLGRAAELFQELDEYLDSTVESISPTLIISEQEGETVINREALLKLPALIQESFLIKLLQNRVQRDIDQSLIKSVLSIIHSETGTTCNVSADYFVLRDRERIILRKVEQEHDFQYDIEPNRDYDFEQFRFSSAIAQETLFSDNPYIEYVDADKLGNRLVLRNWHQGDWFIPLGMSDRRKLSDFFVESKIPLYEKPNIPILESDGEIVWICGKRLDDRFKITNATTNFLRLEYSDKRAT
jgi:tRNA(Ile)-lysidine synthase